MTRLWAIWTFKLVLTTKRRTDNWNIISMPFDNLNCKLIFCFSILQGIYIYLTSKCKNWYKITVITIIIARLIIQSYIKVLFLDTYSKIINIKYNMVYKIEINSSFLTLKLSNSLIPLLSCRQHASMMMKKRTGIVKEVLYPRVSLKELKVC